MSIEQVNLDIMNVNFTINTPSEEKAKKWWKDGEVEVKRKGKKVR